MLNNCCLNVVDNDSNSEHVSVEEKISLAIDQFIKIAYAELKGSSSLELRNELREIILEYIDSENINVYDIDSLDNLAGIAFFRLVKASRHYFYEKNRNTSHETVENLRSIANKYKKDYEMIMISS